MVLVKNGPVHPGMNGMADGKNGKQRANDGANGKKRIGREKLRKIKRFLTRPKMMLRRVRRRMPLVNLNCPHNDVV